MWGDEVGASLLSYVNEGLDGKTVLLYKQRRHATDGHRPSVREHRHSSAPNCDQADIYKTGGYLRPLNQSQPLHTTGCRQVGVNAKRAVS